MMKKKIVFSSLILIFTSFIVFARPVKNLPYPRLTSAIPLDKIVIVVNDTAITQHEINAAMADAKAQLSQQNVPLPKTQLLRKQVINSLINRALLQQLAKRAGITVSDTELHTALLNIAKSHNASLAQMKQSIVAQGMAFSKFENQIRQQILFSKIFNAAIGHNVTVSKQEVESYLQHMGWQDKEYRLDDILIALPDEPTSQQLYAAKNKAKLLLEKINKGANFQKVAVGQSGGTQALKAGDLGWRKLAELPTVFASRVKNMHVGQVIGPVSAPNGFHLLKLVGVRAGKAKLTRQQVQGLIYQRKMAEQREQWLQKMREEAYIKYL